jgi:hypothetical protein
MNERKTGDSTMNSKKLWTAPALKAIALNSARTNPSHGGDGGGTKSKS